MTALSGVRVLELCEIAAGPFCAMTLADMGADVIKVERPGGDAMRSWPPINHGYSENFASVNRNKRSIVLDLKSDEGIAAARALARDSDVVVENFRPGVLPGLGLGYDDLRELNPRLIYCSISAFGQSGPRSTEGGFDLTMQAMAGVMSVTGEPDGAPVKCGVPLCDFVAGLYGAMGVVAALNERAGTGTGQHIDVSMLGTTLAVGALQTSEYFGTGTDPRKLGSAHPRNAPYQAFEAADGFFCMAAGNNNLWQLVCGAVDRADLAEDERYRTPTLRAANQDSLRRTLEDIFTTEPVGHWLKAFADAGVPCSPINSYSQALADPQVTHMGWVQDLELPNGARTRTFGPPLRINGQPSPVRSSPPELGQHTDEILARLAEPNPAPDPVEIDRRGRTLRLTLNRPRSANALHPDAVELLLAALDDLGDAQLVVLRGNGRHFCAGFDLSDLEAISDGDLLWRFVRIELLLQQVQHAHVPTAAFAHGKVMGAGADLFAACTHRIAAPGTTFRMPGWNFDLALGTRRLTRRVGSDRARDILVNSRTVDTDEALELGLVTDMLDQERWDAHEADLGDRAAALSPHAMARLLELTQTDTRTEDLAALVHSATEPGLRDRIMAYRERTLR